MTVSVLAIGIPYLISFAAVLGTFYGIQHTSQINVRLQNDRLRSEEKVKHQEILRSKGEQLYAILDTFESEFRHASASAAGALIKRNRQEAVDALDMRGCDSGLLTITMLTKVYFPSTQPFLSKLRSHWGSLEKIAINVIESVDPKRMDHTARELILLSAQIAENAQKLQGKIIESLQALHADVVDSSSRLTKVA